MILPEHLHTKNLKIIDRYGLDHQLRQLIEECSEVTKAISKLWRAKEEYGQAEIYMAETDLKEEIADVLVLVDQVFHRLGVDKEEVHQKMAYKIDRQLGRMKKN